MKRHPHIAVFVRAILVLVVFALACLPGVARARSQGVKFSRTPAVIQPKNSQTMTLLSANLNLDPIATTSPKLAIVDSSALSTESEGVTFVDVGKSGTGQISVYIVRKGDSLPQIAKMFGVSTNTIMWANNLKSSTVTEGQELVILPISGVKHTVKSGDTLKSIASKYKADITDVLAYNNVTVDTKLTPGDVIIVPDGELGASTSSSGTKSTGRTSALGSSPYRRAGDTTAFEPLTVNVGAYPSYPGYYARPLAGGVKTQDLHGYNAVDLGAPTGTGIYAAAEGTVIISKSGGYNGGYGTYVVVSHPNGTQTLYAHMSRNNVSVGQHVAQGQQIGAVGSTGWSTGAHLHFEIRGAKNPF